MESKINSFSPTCLGSGHFITASEKSIHRASLVMCRSHLPLEPGRLEGHLFFSSSLLSLRCIKWQRPCESLLCLSAAAISAAKTRSSNNFSHSCLKTQNPFQKAKRYSDLQMSTVALSCLRAHKIKF